MTNAFDWKQFTDEEHAKIGGDPFKKMKHNAKISLSASVSATNVQKKKPYHGTILGLSTKADEQIHAGKRNKINKEIGL